MSIGAGGGAAGGAIANHLIRTVFALPPGYETDGPSAEEIHQRSGSRFLIANLLSFLAGTLVTAVFALAFIAFTGRLRNAFPGSIVLVPETIPIYIVLFFAFLTFLVLAYLFVPRGYLGETGYADYVRFNSLKGGYKSEPASRSIAVFIAPLVLAMTVLIADWYCVFGPTEIILNPFFSLGATHHSYRDVSRIYTAPGLIAPNGNFAARQIWQIRFFNGDRWDSDNVPHEFEPGEANRLVEMVSQRSGVPVTRKPVFKQGEL